MTPDRDGARSPCTWLFVPGDRPDRIGKALAGDADAVILDLEDAVQRAAKERARACVSDALCGDIGSRAHVRINDLTTGEAFEDIMSLSSRLPAGIMLSKAESAEQVRMLSWVLEQVERRSGARPGATQVMPLLETAAGLANAIQIAAACGRVRRLAFGAGDLTLDLGMEWTRGEEELLPFRSAVVVASRLAGLDKPIDAVWARMSDSEGMVASANRSRDHGFGGKLCIHPSQVSAVREAFCPPAQAVERARRIVAAFEEAGTSGVGALRVDGELVDRPIYEVALRTLRAAS